MASLFCLAAFAGAAGVEARSIAFLRGNGIYVADSAGAGARFVCRGNDPEISPDGKSLAFTQSRGEGRYIAICSIADGTVRVLTETSGNNCYGPRWAPDGSRVLFSRFAGSPEGLGAWKVGLATLKGAAPVRTAAAGDVFSPAWCNGDRLTFQDLQNVYIAGLDGSRIETLPFSRLAPRGGISSAIRLSWSPDGKRLLFDAELFDEASSSGGTPPSAVFVYERETGLVTRVSPKGVNALNPFWIDDVEILFERCGDTRDLYRINLDGTGLRKVIGNARYPSCSRPPAPL